MTTAEIKSRLDYIVLQELRDHWNKSECYRILDSECESSKMSKALEEDIMKDAKESYKFTVCSMGSVEVSQLIEETPTSKTYQVLGRIEANVFSLVPYAYVMGQTLNKRQFKAAEEAILESIERAQRSFPVSSNSEAC